MQRRTFLEAAGVGAFVGSSTIGGCLARTDDVSGACSLDEYTWCYDAGGRLDAVEDGTILGRMHTPGREGARSEVVAFEADTGEVQWTHGPTNGTLDRYTDLAARDAVYFSRCGDQNCRTLFALELDGEERWTREIDAGYDRPVVVDDTLYFGGDAPVRAIDAATGETLWEYRPESHDSLVAGVGDSVYAQLEHSIVALDRDQGSERWRYEPGEEAEQVPLDTTVPDGVAYVVTVDQVAAVADGEELWRWEFEEPTIDPGTEIAGITPERVFVHVEYDTDTYRLLALDARTGQRVWQSDSLPGRGLGVSDGVVFVGVHGLRALDATTGDERWRTDAVGGPVNRVIPGDPSTETGPDLLVQAGDSKLLTVTSDGERTWSDTVDGTIYSAILRESIVTTTRQATYALDPTGGS